MEPLRTGDETAPHPSSPPPADEIADDARPTARRLCLAAVRRAAHRHIDRWGVGGVMEMAFDYLRELQVNTLYTLPLNV